MAKALIPLANGVEEMEAVIVIDTLRRAGWQVVCAGMTPGVITASRGVKLVPDHDWADVAPSTFDILIIPGGKDGVDALRADARVLDCVRSFAHAGKWIAALCAGPLVLQAAGILKDRKVTCHPNSASELTATLRLPNRVVHDGHLITSQGPGTSFEFVLTIIRSLDGAAKADELAKSMLVHIPAHA